ncbi:hypothetical protein BLNAU_9646 [Blattamonas nauphoetae]|uniref:RRM domain-containing protein n=1 Tax=Blattamonas nauphoetae TaxID=2049346 RepID=A0ABQ9XVB8_9EUKA|nr:hypothetical protein BLNAU_9646 [Blattamonas nauphoetae]
MCRGGESGVWMDGVLNSGVVERVCGGVCSEKNRKVVIGMVRVLDSLCFGMKRHIGVFRKREVVRRLEREKERKERKISKETKEKDREGGVGDEEEWRGSEFSLESRCLSGLGLIEETLGRLLRGLMEEEEAEEQARMEDGEGGRREGNGKDDERERRKLEEKVGGMIVRHFGRSVSQRAGKIGVIGIDIGKERFWMKKREEDRNRENSEKLKHELEEMRRKDEERERRMKENEEKMKRKMEEMERNEEARQNEHEEKMEEMEKEHRKTQAELKRQFEMNEEFIKLGADEMEWKRREEAERKRKEEEAERKRREEEEAERKRQSKTGAATIEWFDRSKFILSGSVFKSSDISNLLSSAFGPVIVRFTLVIKNQTGNNLKFGVASVEQTDQLKSSDSFTNLPQTAGWDVTSRFCRQNSNNTHSGTACEKGVSGQRVVLEADGREGKRTLRLSQNGQTQPTFFSNIPVPFRFVARLNTHSLEIESVEVVKEPLMVGGSIEVRMD